MKTEPESDEYTAGEYVLHLHERYLLKYDAIAIKKEAFASYSVVRRQNTIIVEH